MNKEDQLYIYMFIYWYLFLSSVYWEGLEALSSSGARVNIILYWKEQDLNKKSTRWAWNIVLY